MEMMISASDRYFKALSELDIDAYLSCFSPDAELFDPYGGRPFKGNEGLVKWFEGMERTWSKFTMNSVANFVSGDREAVQWQATGSAHSGREAHFSGINVFTMDDTGLITRLEGYWDFKSMLAQIS